MPVHRFARIPGATRHLCGFPSRLAARGSTAPRGPPHFRGERLRSASADRAVCDGLARPPASCLATVHGARARCFRPTSASHCFQHEHSRLFRSQHLFEACASPLRAKACTFADGGWGTWRFTTPDPLRRAAPGWRAAFSSANSQRHRVSGTPVAFPWRRLARREAAFRSGRPRPCSKAVREGAAHATIRGTFHRRLPARLRGPHPVSKTVT